MPNQVTDGIQKARVKQKRSWGSSKVAIGVVILAVSAAGASAFILRQATPTLSDVSNREVAYDLSEIRFDAGPITLKEFSLPYVPPLALAAGREFDFHFAIETSDLPDGVQSASLFLDPVADNESCEFGRYEMAIEGNMDRQILFGIGNIRGCSSTNVLGIDISVETASGVAFPPWEIRFENYITGDR